MNKINKQISINIVLIGEKQKDEKKKIKKTKQNQLNNNRQNDQYEVNESIYLLCTKSHIIFGCTIYPPL